MIGKGKAISHTRASMMYGWNQEKNAEVVFSQNLAGENPSEITSEFRFIQQMNQNCQKNTLSFVLSPTIEDGRNLNQKSLKEICERFMKEMKLGERQAIAFVHKDKDHKHIHLYVNRIDFNGKAYNDSFIGKRSQQAAEKVAEQMQLTTVKQLQVEKEFNLRDIRSEIKRRHDITMKQFQPKTFKEYIEVMKISKIEVIPCINKANKLQGFRFRFDGFNLKGSEIHRSMSIGNIGKQMAATVGVKNFIKNNTELFMLNKAVSLPTKLAANILKHAVKREIKRGFGF
ncbi:mobilization protein [Antarcticibacterium arcticum]|uniref:Mobilization protein n=1 Tax=Antarcticibacterium arcticum TaxID=2585771 RepID=A0A5B8YFG2_9FLAO|nr:relaxase/mobilization nuclease domain-containing protein [Antarcticibacterium arcticum]QED36712.1 mobilization protein [Antarcticibacterium arcticum]